MFCSLLRKLACINNNKVIGLISIQKRDIRDYANLVELYQLFVRFANSKVGQIKFSYDEILELLPHFCNGIFNLGLKNTQTLNTEIRYIQLAEQSLHGIHFENAQLTCSNFSVQTKIQAWCSYQESKYQDIASQGFTFPRKGRSVHGQTYSIRMLFQLLLTINYTSFE